MTLDALRSCFDFAFAQAIAKLQSAPLTPVPNHAFPQHNFREFSVSESAQLAHGWLCTLFSLEAERKELARLLDELCGADGRLVRAASFYYDKVP